MIEPVIYVFQLDEDGGGEEMDGEDDIATYKEWPLPNRDFHGQWEALVFDDDDDDDDRTTTSRSRRSEARATCREMWEIETRRETFPRLFR
jgi:hypothetical protein